MKYPPLGLAIIGVLFAASAMARELTDTSFGFRLQVPDDFTQMEVDSSEPDTIYKFIDREPAPNDPAHVIQIQRLRGVITPDSRLKQEELQVEEGIATTLQDFTWKGHKMDVIRQSLALPGGIQIVVFCIRYPLGGEAVQLQVAGPSADEQALYSLFSQTASHFEPTKPLHAAPARGVRELPGGERTGKLVSGIVKLGIAVTAILLLLLIAMRGLSKKKGDGQP